MDFAKAFDKVPHGRLLEKLRAKGVGGRLLSWIEEWLNNRTQRVRIGTERSESCDVDSGVPQGIVMGPPLFTVYIDDIDKFAEQIDLILKFADDTKGLQELADKEDWKKLQGALDGLVEWARIWGMEFNIKNAKYYT